jgi:hypothetical protein
MRRSHTKEAIVISEQEERYPLEFDLSHPSIPPRSRLFNWEPAAVGTPFVECLSSYISRLAQAHSVSSLLLLTKEVGRPDNGFASPITTAIDLFQRQINGHGLFVTNLINSLSRLTSRTDLAATTMSRWSEVLPTMALIRTARAWCPACYQDALEDHQIIFDQLVWTLNAVQICPIHKLMLATCCPACAKRIPHLAARFRSGYCTHCLSWLGARGNTSLDIPKQDPEETEWQFWAAIEVGKLLAIFPDIEDPKPESIRDLITQCFGSSKSRYGTAFARSAGVSSGHFNGWKKGDHLACLESLLKLCFRARIAPAEFFSGNLQVAQTGLETIPARYPRNLKDTEGLCPQPLSADDTEKVLRAALGVNPPEPLKALQRDTRWTTRRMRYHFPELCRAVVDRYLTVYKRPVDVERYRAVVDKALTEKPPPSLGKVSNRSGTTTTTLKDCFPSLCQRIIARHHRYRFKLNWKEIGIKLGDYVIQEPPPSLRGIARDLKTNVSALSTRFPELCKVIGARSVRHRKVTREERKKALRDDTFAAILIVKSEGLYPSTARVYRHMRLKSNLGTVHHIVKDIRREMKI